MEIFECRCAERGTVILDGSVQGPNVDADGKVITYQCQAGFHTITLRFPDGQKCIPQQVEIRGTKPQAPLQVRFEFFECRCAERGTVILDGSVNQGPNMDHAGSLLTKECNGGCHAITLRFPDDREFTLQQVEISGTRPQAPLQMRFEFFECRCAEKGTVILDGTVQGPNKDADGKMITYQCQAGFHTIMLRFADRQKSIPQQVEISGTKPRAPMEVEFGVLLAPRVTADPGNGHSGLVISCPDHAIPFGVIFEEYAARRGADLERNVQEGCEEEGETSDPSRQEPALTRVRGWLEARDKKYRELEEAKKKTDPHALPTEIENLEGECRRFDGRLTRLLHKMNGSALCLSGGGIRSASFGLGVLEGLARFSMGPFPARACKGKENRKQHGALHTLDYLSTVSGGGYIGSWQTAWVYRRRMAAIQQAEMNLSEAADKLERIQDQSLLSRAARWMKGLTRGDQQVGVADLAAAQSELDQAKQRLRTAKATNWEPSYDEVVTALAGGNEFTSGDPAPRPVRHLREYTSYLAPAMGLSLDSWSLAAIVLRNLLINWVMLVPLLLVVVALPQVSFHITVACWLCWRDADVAAMVVLAFLFLLATRFAGLNLPSHRRVGKAGPSLGWVLLGFAGPVLLANWIAVQVWKHKEQVLTVRGSGWGILAAVFVLACVGFGSLTWRRLSSRTRMMGVTRPDLVPKWRGWGRFLLMLSAAFVSAGVTTGLLVLLATRVFPKLPYAWKLGGLVLTIDDKLYTILAFPLVTLALLVSHSLFTGLVGIFEEEEDREWQCRVGGLLLAVITAWVLAHAIALYAPQAFSALLAAVGGAILGGIGSALGWSGTTSAGPRPIKVEQLSKVGSFLKKYDLLLPALCVVALLLLTLAAATGESALAGLVVLNEKATEAEKALIQHFIILLASFGVALAVNWAINVNLFSLHGMYRMRLMRAFLGASNTQRDPDAFTRFDPTDTPLETDLPKSAGAPLHVINATLNLVGTRNLAWRQRKAESFTFSPLHSGAWRLAYVPTEEYAGAKGVSLATAMAVSGAAFNPNMGYHSSPLVTLLMTFFNVRLGWWLPNPAREAGVCEDGPGRPERNATLRNWLCSVAGLSRAARASKFLHKDGPAMALLPLIREALGLTDDSYRWIEVTDGGHFENLGLYEMVLRRCHNIVVVDAGADPRCQFEDLGNALRKIEIDLGIPIRFEHGLKMKAGATPDNRYCAVATIDYGCADAGPRATNFQREELAGKLIYIKACLTGTEPPDIKQYALTHHTFPHETTANQFFNEAQFESYRHLGSFEVETVVKEGGAPLGVDFGRLVKAAGAYASAESRGRDNRA